MFVPHSVNLVPGRDAVGFKTECLPRGEPVKRLYRAHMGPRIEETAHHLLIFPNRQRVMNAIDLLRFSSNVTWRPPRLPKGSRRIPIEGDHMPDLLKLQPGY